MRVGLSKKVRFEVFKRDGFRCVYCGSVPSEDILLEVDHVHPVADGGTNDEDNLVTACVRCNRGKGAVPLSSVPNSLESKAAEVAEREAQIMAYRDIMEASRQRKEDDIWSIADIFMERFGDQDILRSNIASIRTLLGRLEYHEVREAMEIATGKISSKTSCFRYFCGICWNKIKQAEGAST